MNKQEILAILQSCPTDSPLESVVKRAIDQIARSTSFVSGGNEADDPIAHNLRGAEYNSLEASHYLNVYEHRLKFIKMRGVPILPGLEETVEIFPQQKGKLKCGYIKIDNNEIVDFWTNEKMNWWAVFWRMTTVKISHSRPNEH